MDLPIYQVDAFTTDIFRGNPAAVVVLEEWLDVALMQAIAAENNLSETAFIVPKDERSWQIRWFTPKVEVPLCGHATLASAAVIRWPLGHSDWPIMLHSASGLLKVDLDGDRFVLDLPVNRPEPTELPQGIVAALDVAVEEAWQAGDFIVVVLATERDVAAVAPNIRSLHSHTEKGVIVTAPGDSVDFVSRMFAPGMGIDEDPVTGAAHCILTPYWADCLHKDRLSARQISARTGDLECELKGERVRLWGNACLYLAGTISVQA